MQRAGGAAMTDPITPPPELVRQWVEKSVSEHDPGVTYSLFDRLATQAARWGADQELKACCLLLDSGEHAATYGCHDGTSLRAARRPKPPSLREQALLAIDVAVADGRLSPDVSKVVRHALERLKELEGPND